VVDGLKGKESVSIPPEYRGSFLADGAMITEIQFTSQIPGYGDQPPLIPPPHVEPPVEPKADTCPVAMLLVPVIALSSVLVFLLSLV
jgi:hypothetical protein